MKRPPDFWLFFSLFQIILMVLNHLQFHEAYHPLVKKSLLQFHEAYHPLVKKSLVSSMFGCCEFFFFFFFFFFCIMYHCVTSR